MIISHELIKKILGDRNLQEAASRAIMSTWSRQDLDEAIEYFFQDEKDKIEFIIDNDLILDELELYFDFNDYPDHEEALLKAGVIKYPSDSEQDVTLSESYKMKGQPKLFE
jgi:hypothetical protein